MSLLLRCLIVARFLPAWSERPPSSDPITIPPLNGETTGLDMMQRKRLLKQLSLEEQQELLGVWEAWPSDQELKVMYGVFTSPLPKYAEQMAAVEATWANEVPPQKLVVVGVNGTNPDITYRLAPNCKDGHINNAGISCKEATLLTTGHELGADWVVVLGSDNYVFPRELESRLVRHNKDKPQILGVIGCGEGKYCEDHKAGLCGGAGYAISRGALDKMIGQGEMASENFIQESMQTARTVGGYWSDQVTSCIARRRGVKEVQLHGLYGWKLCPNEPGAFECEFNKDAYRQKMMAPSSKKPLTFHYISPSDMHTLHQMVQDMRTGLSLLADEAVVQRVAEGHVNESLLGISTIDDNYEAQRLAYVQMVDKELYSFNASASAKPE